MVLHGAIAGAVRRAGDEAVDRWLGIESATPAPHAEPPEPQSQQGDEPYQPTNWLALLWVHRWLERFGPSGDETFVDFGAGKGRVVLLAARLPFRSVVGVERSEALAAVARENLDRNRSRIVCREVRIEQADIAAFPVPDDLAVGFLYNPVRGEPFIAAIERIRESLARRPRRLRLVYGNPTMHDALLAADFRVTHSARFLNWNVYAPIGARCTRR